MCCLLISVLCSFFFFTNNILLHASFRLFFPQVINTRSFGFSSVWVWTVTAQQQQQQKVLVVACCGALSYPSAGLSECGDLWLWQFTPTTKESRGAVISATTITHAYLKQSAPKKRKTPVFILITSFVTAIISGPMGEFIRGCVKSECVND